MAGCEWNNKLAHEIFKENSEKFGKEKALQLLRNDIQSWVWEKDGKQFGVKYKVENNQLVNEELGKSITGMIEDSIYTHGDTVAANVKENAPLELVEAERATQQAIRGDKEIKIHEYYRTESGETVIRYITVLTQDAHNKQLYHGSRIDLGKNYSIEEALKRSGEKIVIPVNSGKQVTSEHRQPQYSAVHMAIREAPLGVTRVVSHTASEISYTARSVQRYIEKRRKTDPKSIDIWKRVMESGKKRVRKAIRRATQPVEVRTDSKPFISELKAQQHVKKSVEKSIARHERKGKKKMKFEMRRRFLLQKDLRVGRSKEKKFKPHNKRRNERRILFAETNRLKKQKSAKEHSARKRKEKLSKEKTVRLFSIVKKLLRTKEIKILRKKAKIEFKQKPRLERKQKAKEHALNFSTAFIFWLLLRSPLFVSQSKRFHVSIDESKNVRRGDKILIKTEPTPWLLLTIIWHLAMIRESRGAGSGSAGQSKQKKVKKMTYISQFAPQGVIFAYAT